MPSYERLSGKCFKGCMQEKKLITIDSHTHSLKHLTLNLSCDGTDFPVQSDLHTYQLTWSK